jgi:hypothetical protein
VDPTWATTITTILVRVVVRILLLGALQVVAGLPMRNLLPEQVTQRTGDTTHERRRGIVEEMVKKGNREVGVEVRVEHLLLPS